MLDKIILGKKGEELAAKYLQQQGYKIIARNFRIRNGEVDIIALDPSSGTGKKATLVFIEVKTRLTTQFGTPLEAISYYKLQALVRSAQVYKSIHRNLPEGMRIDAISIMLDPAGEVDEIEHVKSIT